MDVIDAAVSKVEQPARELNATVQITLPSGRAVALQVPVNLTALEAVQLVGFITTQLPAELAKGRPGPRLLVPNGVHLGRG